jgi:hypothetical protein
MSDIVRRQVLGGMLAATVSSSSASVARQQSLKPRTRSWLDLLNGSAVSVLEFVPSQYHADIRSQTCRIDLAPFINAAIKHVLSLPGGGSLFFPRGAYEVSEIDATNNDAAQFDKALHIIGEGRFITTIRPAKDAAVLLNAAGRNNMTVQSIQFESARFASQVGIYLCRTQESPNCNNNRFFDVQISGNFAQACAISMAAESTTWLSCRFVNSNPVARHRCFVTSQDPGTVPVQSSLNIKPVASSNTDNVMIDCEFYTPYDRAEPILYWGNAAYTMQGCTVLTGDSSHCRLATYRPTGNVFNGPVTWTAPHFEVSGSGNALHFLDAPPGVSYFRGVSCYGGNYVVGSGTDILTFDPARNASAQPVLMAATWTVPSIPWGTRDLRFQVFGLSDSAIDLKLADGVGDVQISGYAADSRISAARSVVARNVVSPNAND